MNKKIFVFDLDGTLLVNNSYILPESIEAIKRAKQEGHIIAIATGRSYLFTKYVGKNIELFDFLICNNGSYFYDAINKTFSFKDKVSLNAMKKMIEISQKHQSYFIVHTLKKTFSTLIKSNSKNNWNTKEIIQAWEKIKNVKLKNMNKIIHKHNITQASLLAPKNLIKKFKEYLKNECTDIELHVSSDIYLDVNSKGTSKFSTLEKICELNGINKKNIIAFGDSGNDIQMLKGAEIGFCMKNGTKEAKLAANYVIGKNTTNSIAKEIMKLL